VKYDESQQKRIQGLPKTLLKKLLLVKSMKKLVKFHIKFHFFAWQRLVARKKMHTLGNIGINTAFWQN
jgi:uncharacterized protein with ParB-like and HNH nuclease domain